MRDEGVEDDVMTLDMVVPSDTKPGTEADTLQANVSHGMILENNVWMVNVSPDVKPKIEVDALPANTLCHNNVAPKNEAHVVSISLFI